MNKDNLFHFKVRRNASKLFYDSAILLQYDKEAHHIRSPYLPEKVRIADDSAREIL